MSMLLSRFHCFIGHRFHTYEEMCSAELHRSWRSGISPSGSKTVAESVVVRDPEWADGDHGDSLWYTGQGKTKDQELTKGNRALVNAFEASAAIRVIRGYELQSKSAPSWGYRYDGLYRIAKYQSETHEGRRVWKFLMERLEGQPEAPYKSREASPPPPPPGFRPPIKKKKEKREKTFKAEKPEKREMTEKPEKKPKKEIKEKKERSRKKSSKVTTSSSSTIKRAQPRSSSDSERSDDLESESTPPSITPTPGDTHSKTHPPSSLLSGKMPLDQFLAVHSGFTSMSSIEIQEWISNGLCAFCGSVVDLNTYRKHYRKHLHLVRSYLPEGDSRHHKPSTHHHRHRTPKVTATKSSPQALNSPPTTQPAPPDQLTNSSVDMPVIDNSVELESYEDLILDHSTNLDSSEGEIDMDQDVYTLFADILAP
ncbi:HNH endonuclease [Pelomyxa schiedti]|nr:HNH endonuclease [Pelomyxa schiedti]